MKVGSLILIAALAAPALPAQAQVVFAEPIAGDAIEPFGYAVYAAACETGSVISGGYQITFSSEPSDYSILGSYPEGAYRWAVMIQNRHERPLELGGTVYVVCTEN